MAEVGTAYENPITHIIEWVIGRRRFENLGICPRCSGIVEPPDESYGVYTCCKCGLKFVVRRA